MKNIIILALISLFSINTMAVGVFNHQIPQPDRITNSDYDGDGKVDSIDEDDDGDGILDENDSNPFGRPGGGSSTPAESGIETFSVNKNEIFLGESVTFNWNYTGNSNLTLFGGSLPSNGLDVTGLSTESDAPNESTTYSLYTDTGVSSVNVDVLPEPIVNSFTINGSSQDGSFFSGDSLTINWNITGGKNISIIGGNLVNKNNLSSSGTITDAPSQNTTYTLFDGLNYLDINMLMESKEINISYDKSNVGISGYYYSSGSTASYNQGITDIFVSKNLLPQQTNKYQAVRIQFPYPVKLKQFSYTGTGPAVCGNFVNLQGTNPNTSSCINIGDLSNGNNTYRTTWWIIKRGWSHNLKINSALFEG